MYFNGTGLVSLGPHQPCPLYQSKTCVYRINIDIPSHWFTICIWNLKFQVFYLIYFVYSLILCLSLWIFCQSYLWSCMYQSSFCQLKKLVIALISSINISIPNKVWHSFRCDMQPQVTNLFNYFKLIHLSAWTPAYFSLLLLLLFGSRLPSSVLHNPAMSFWSLSF